MRHGTKIIAVAAAAAMAAAMAGCGNGTEAVSVDAIRGTEAAQEEETAYDENAYEDMYDDASEDDSLSIDIGILDEDTQEATEEEEEAGDASEGTDIVNAIDAAGTTDTDPAGLGQWVKTARYSTADGKYHTVYVRATEVTTQTEDAEAIQRAIDGHNGISYDFEQIDLSSAELPDDVEWCMLEYEVYVPDSFPTDEGWIVEPSMNFTQANIGGGGFPSADGSATYVGLGTNTQDLNSDVDTFYPGNAYTFRCLYTMVKGYTDYVFQITSYPDGDEGSADTMYYAYIADK